MKIQCGLSNVEFTCEHFPASLFSRECYHPIFHLPQKKLLGFLHKWGGGELTSTDSYLLFLAILNSSELVQFRVPVFRNEKTDSIVALNMETLAKAVIKLNTVATPSFNFPSFAITVETRFLENIPHWIQAWEDAYKDFLDGYKSAHENQKLIKREAALERLIKNPYKAIHSYAGQIAEWAALAGDFPTYLVLSPFNGVKVPMAEYWKAIIIKAASPDGNIFQIPRVDLEDLIEHCECNVPIGNIFAHSLFKIIRGCRDKQKDFLGLDNSYITPMSGTGGFEILSPEHAQIKIMIDSAPAEKPVRSAYPKLIDWLRAEARWNMKAALEAEIAKNEGKINEYR
jgi:hypothetical protein